jgi:hypothetical protein
LECIKKWVLTESKCPMCKDEIKTIKEVKVRRLFKRRKLNPPYELDKENIFSRSNTAFGMNPNEESSSLISNLDR